MDSLTPILLLAALTTKATSLLKFINAKEWSRVVAQLLAFALGIGVMFLVKAGGLANGLVIAGHNVSDLNGWGTAIAGIIGASVGSTIYDFRAAVDNTDSAAEPSLTDGAAPPVAP